jgi:hypothetical protein
LFILLMRITRVILILLLLSLHLHGQTPIGSWSDHLIYNTAKNVTVTKEEVYASTGSSIIVYNKEFSELKKLSRITGLTETGISNIAWSEESKALIIAYSTSNVDILKSNVVYNIPDISRKYIPGKKEINRIRTNGNLAYLACSFGIVVVDIIKKEIRDTWKLTSGFTNPDVWDLAFGNGKIYAATGNGVFSADLSNPGLSFSGNWDLLNILPNPNGRYTSLVYSGNRLYANRSDPSSEGDQLYMIDGGSSLFSYIPGVYVSSLDPAQDGFTVSSKNSVRYYNNDHNLIKTISTYYSDKLGTPDISQAVADNNDIWIADIKSGLIRGENMSSFSALTLPGPASNNVIYLTSYNGKTLICDGALDPTWTNKWKPLQVSIYENNIWTSIAPHSITDAMRAIVDPDNSNHFFISTWGMGLLEYLNNNLEKQYTQSNSPLQTIIPGQPYVRICGMAIDKYKNLWITQSEVVGSIKVLKPDGNWIVNPITINAPRIGDIIITKTGHKWVILPTGYGLFILDDNNTPDIFTDDRYKRIAVKDVENNIVPQVYSIAEDLDGNIWVGTDQGPLVYYNPEKVFDTDLKAFRILTPRNDGTGLADKVLVTESITSIAVDGANRKWLGTLNSGAYLLSPDGTNRIKNYNEENSPIFSNNIVSLAIDNKTGDVWFGTLKGIQSVRGDATPGEDRFTNVYAFPNPVREDFTGNVTITGLMRDSQIRITDISGNLVYETVSDGGMASWDLKTYNGKHVTTGVYLVFCASLDGSQSYVTKMLVIR